MRIYLPPLSTISLSLSLTLSLFSYPLFHITTNKTHENNTQGEENKQDNYQFNN